MKPVTIRFISGIMFFVAVFTPVFWVKHVLHGNPPETAANVAFIIAHVSCTTLLFCIIVLLSEFVPRK